METTAIARMEARLQDLHNAIERERDMEKKEQLLQVLRVTLGEAVKLSESLTKIQRMME